MTRPWLLPTMLAGVAAYVLALVGATITQIDPWYHSLSQPAWAPPDALFGMVWTLIFALAALSASIAWREAPNRRSASTVIGLFAFNGFLGICWSLLFFRLQKPDWAFAELVLLWLSIVVLIAVCHRISRSAGLLLLPYLLWVTFAGALNWEIVVRNGPF